MAWDEAIAAILRADLASAPGTISEKRMFGGLCFLMDGNMLCGTWRDGAMYRVGKEVEATALALPHVAAMELGGRRMGGLVAVGREAVEDPAIRSRLLALATAFVGRLPAK